MTNKFTVGDHVRIKSVQSGSHVLSPNVFEVVAVAKLGATYTYTVISMVSGQKLAGIVESRLVVEVTKPRTKAPDPDDSDYLLDCYNAAMFLYELFGDEKYAEAANESRAMWEKLFGQGA